MVNIVAWLIFIIICFYGLAFLINLAFVLNEASKPPKLDIYKKDDEDKD